MLCGSRQFVEVERQRRREPRAKMFADLAAQHAGRRLQRSRGICLILFIAEHSEEDIGVLQIARDANVRDGDKSETRIAKPLFETRRDNLLDPLRNSSRTLMTHATQFTGSLLG